MRFYQSPSGPFRHLLPELVWCLPGEDRKILLTFDDGPDPVSTPVILDILAEKNASAIFFCLGRNVERYPLLYDRIVSEGHIVGNHTYSHLDGWRTGVDEYLRDVEQAGRFIESDLFRPPFGRIRPSQIRRLKSKFRIMMWSWMFLDFSGVERTGSRRIPHEKYLYPGSILVFHDSQKAAPITRLLLKDLLEQIDRYHLKAGLPVWSIPHENCC